MMKTHKSAHAHGLCARLARVGEAREQGRLKREEQQNNTPASKKYQKSAAEKLKKAEGPGAKRRAHDASEKVAPPNSRTKKQIDEDYKVK